VPQAYIRRYHVLTITDINLTLIIVIAEVNVSAFKRYINIFANNQAAIYSLTRLEGRSGVYILKQIAASIKSL
jgi:hypothetical protein